MRTIDIELDEITFAVKKPNIGQVERISEAISSKPTIAGMFDAVRIALERAEPKANFDDLAPSIEQVSAATNAIIEFMGAKKTAGPLADQQAA